MQILTNIRKRHEADLLNTNTTATSCSTHTDVNADDDPDTVSNKVLNYTSPNVCTTDNNTTNTSIDKAPVLDSDNKTLQALHYSSNNGNTDASLLFANNVV